MSADLKPRRTQRADTRQTASVRVLVLSQHEAVRQQLVAYLARSPALAVQGEPFAAETILCERPVVLVLDLSQLGPDALHQAIEAARRVGARLVALASIREPTVEQIVLEADGIYRLKSAGADGLAQIVREAAPVKASR
jgi:hypothetical protein